MTEKSQMADPGAGELKQLAEEQRRIAEIGRIVGSTLDISDVYQSFAEHAQALVNADRMVIAVFSEDKTELIEQHVAGMRFPADSERGTRQEINDDIYETLIVGRAPIVYSGESLANYARDSAVEDDRRDSDLKALMVVPLVWQGNSYGVISFRALDPDAFGAHQLDIGQQIAGQIAGAIATAHQYAELKRESHERDQLAELQGIAGSSLNIEEIFEAFATQAKTLVPADHLVLTIVDQGSNIIGRHSHGMKFHDPSLTKLSAETRDGLRRLGENNRTHFVALSDDYEKALVDLPEEVGRYAAGLRSMLALPLIWRDELVGILTFRSKDPEAYQARQIASAEQVAIHIAGAVHAANQFIIFENESRERDQLAEIGRIVSSTLDIESVFASFTEAARKLVPFDRLAISIIDTENNLISDTFVAGQRLNNGNMSGTVSLADSAVPSEVYESHHVFIADAKTLLARSRSDASNDNRERIAAGLISAMYVPVVLQGTIVGTLVFRSKEPDPFSESEANLAERIASNIGGVIAASQQRLLIQNESIERRQLAEQQSRIAGIGRIASSTLDLDAMFTRFVEESRELLPFDRIAIITLSEDRSSVIDALVHGTDSSTAPAGAVISIDDNPLQKKVFETGNEVVLSGEEYEKHTLTEPLERARRDAGLVSLLMSPMIWQDEVIGLISFRSVLPDAYGESEIGIARQICAQIAGAIAVSEQYGLIQEESIQRRRLAQEQSRIAEIGRTISSTLDLDEVFSRFGEEAQELVPFDRLVISLNKPDGLTAIDAFVSGDAAEGDGNGEAFEIVGGMKESVFHENKVFAANEPEFKKITAQYPSEVGKYEQGYRSVLIAPLIWQRSAIGTLIFRSRSLNPYRDREIDLAEQIGAQIAGAIATSNQYRLLEESESNYRALVENTHILIWRMDADARFTYVNESLERTLGYSADELYGKRYTDFTERRDLPGIDKEVSQRLKERASNHEIASGETIYLHKDGSAVHLAYSSVSLFDSDDEFIGIRGTGLDVTSERSAQDEIKIQVAALEAAGDAVAVLHPDSTIGYVNQAFVDQLGYSRQEIIGKQSSVLRSSQGSDRHYENVWRIVKAGHVWRGTQLSQRKDGSVFTIDASLNPVLAEDGTITGYVSIRRDITEQIRAEQDRQARAELDAQNQQLQEINKQREEFFSSVSHELRTPLTAVTAFSDILSRNRDGNLTTGQVDQINVIRRNSRSLINLVEDMLDMSRLNNSSLRIDRLPMELDEMIDSVLESLEPTAAERNQSLAFQSGTVGIWIDADNGRLIQVVSNLITNASKYSTEGSLVEISTKLVGNDVELIVADSGYGMSPEELAMLFTPFYRSGRDEIMMQPGTGLGMSISKTLVDLHDGEIEVESTLHEGTTVTVKFPNIVVAS